MVRGEAETAPEKPCTAPSAATDGLWPPASTPTARPCAAAIRTAATTSREPAAPTTNAGRDSTARFSPIRSASYACSPGRKIRLGDTFTHVNVFR
ncbi:hypothetical protein GCM10022224_009540 [Nonomuraea antimicrobica]|uniref:Uncharacterized protein n=1 Tax=Nonomuraea antimicrobica TaxID=561173 RepID=A0ABP7B4G8_9ACTN